jgi:hypothetical protein
MEGPAAAGVGAPDVALPVAAIGVVDAVVCW